MHYPWHPYFRRKVLVRRVDQRAIGQFVLVQGPTGVVVSIAGWMLDPVACATMVVGAPRVDLATLLELKQVLIRAGMSRESLGDNGFVQEKGDEVSRLAGNDSGSADESVVQQQPSRRTGGSRTRQGHLGTSTDTNAGCGRQSRGAS